MGWAFSGCWGTVHGFYEREVVAMLNFRLVLSSEQREALLSHLKAAERRGNLATAKRFLAILALGENRPIQEAVRLLNLTGDAVRSWLRKYLLLGVSGLESKKSPGRPPKLTKSQKQELTRLLDEGPAKLGLSAIAGVAQRYNT
jgi:hypothetical protein